MIKVEFFTLAQANAFNNSLRELNIYGSVDKHDSENLWVVSYADDPKKLIRSKAAVLYEAQEALGSNYLPPSKIFKLFDILIKELEEKL